MKLLIITQKVDINDDNLGFFHDWIKKFSEKVDKLYVICLWQGEYNLPQNVEVYSMGKESGASKLGQFFRLQKYLLKNLKEVDGVFVHMAPIYAIASFPFVRLFGKRMILWYTHKSRNWKLWIAEKIVNKILTASKESFRIKSKKIEILGHGIDIKLFCPQENNIQSSNFTILTAGRIVPSKDLETQILAFDILVNKESIKNINMRILGSEFPEEYPDYLNKVRNLIKEKGLVGHIFFEGSARSKVMPRYYHNSCLFINSSRTGSIDKVVLEAMACGLPVISSNESFASILPLIDKNLYFREGDAEELSQKIKYVMNLSGEDRIKLAARLREIVVKNHNLENLTTKIINEFKR